MPILTRWFIKTSFVFLGIALALGILLASGSMWKSLPLLTDASGDVSRWPTFVDKKKSPDLPDGLQNTLTTR